ncbi:MAG: hypothetical protein JNJ73_02990 [Hyphomonadaceae bacterium]|nr:hypothetical protein [Hyphomonadaceae bacterium]
MPVYAVWANWGVTEWVAVASAALALASFLFNWSVVSRQASMQAEALKSQLDRDVLEWAHETIDALSEGVWLARAHANAQNRAVLSEPLAKLSWRLSSLADRGRMFFPNLAPDAHGTDKPGAFQGYRPPVLDAVLFALYQVEQLTPVAPSTEMAMKFIQDCRRLLVSEVQYAIDPRRKGRMLTRLMTGAKKTDVAGFRMAADLATSMRMRYPELPISDRGADWITEMERRMRRAH